MVNESANTLKFNDRQTIQLLIVKAVEQSDSGIFSPELISAANIAAYEARDNKAFLEKRKNFLFRHIPESIRRWNRLALLPEDWMPITLLISLIFGVISNYLGSTEQIHVIYNPLTFLILWNLFIYFILIFKKVFGIGRDLKSQLPSFSNIRFDEVHPPQKTRKSGSFLLNWFLGGIYKKIIYHKVSVDENASGFRNVKEILTSFWNSYKAIAGRTIVMRFKSLLNLAAIGFLVGALIGVYIRGFFFEYNMVWKSTFLSDIEKITTLLNIVLGSASILIEGQLITSEAVRELLKSEGTLAALWIHKLALTAFLFIFIPRAVLAYFYSVRAKQSLRGISIDEPYFQTLLSDTKKNLKDSIMNGVSGIFRKKIVELADEIAQFVVSEYFDKIVQPVLISFRNSGGKISGLNSKLEKSQKEFGPKLSEYLAECQQEFNLKIQDEINLFLGRKLDLKMAHSETQTTAEITTSNHISGTVASDVGDTIGTIITATVASAVATMSGGLGESLGIAIISGILGVSGPVGLLIGGVLALVAAGGVYKASREFVNEKIKDVSLPAIMISMALRDSKIEDAKRNTGEQVRQDIIAKFEPQIDSITAKIFETLSKRLDKSAPESDSFN